MESGEKLWWRLGHATDTTSMTNLDQPYRQALDEFERSYFEYHQSKKTTSRGKMMRLVKISGMERTWLYRKIKKLGLTL
jgi:DNA-binding NtrC family response regulator